MGSKVKTQGLVHVGQRSTTTDSSAPWVVNYDQQGPVTPSLNLPGGSETSIANLRTQWIPTFSFWDYKLHVLFLCPNERGSPRLKMQAAPRHRKEGRACLSLGTLHFCLFFLLNSAPLGLSKSTALTSVLDLEPYIMKWAWIPFTERLTLVSDQGRACLLLPYEQKTSWWGWLGTNGSYPNSTIKDSMHT